jgi:hypothetical protein
MGDNAFSGYDDDDDDFEFDGGDALSKVRKANRAQNKRIKELEEVLAEREKTLNELSGKVKVTGVTEVLKARGANPALARYALKDDVEPTEEAVDAWLAENGSLFGYEPKSAEAPADSGAPSVNGAADVDTSVLADALAAMQRVQNGEANSAPALAGNDKVMQALAAIDNKATSFNDAAKALGQLGITI